MFLKYENILKSAYLRIMGIQINQILKYIDPKLFFRNVYFDSKKDTILFLCSQMLKCKYANTEFIDNVFEREKMSNTSYFNKFAIPHAIYFGNFKTSIAVLINDRPISWGNESRVNVVLLISINERDIQSFNTIYTSLVDLLLDDSEFEKIIQINDYQQLIDYLTHSLG